MKTTKRILMVFALLVFSQATFAQDYDRFLQRAQQRLDEGDCDGAQKNYNVYKELSGKTLSSFEVLIEDCLAENHFRIGDIIDVNGEKYIIAYLSENHQHGFAIKDEGIKCMTTSYVDDHKIPSLEEMNIIYKNNAKIGLTDIYWTRTRNYNRYSNNNYYYTIDFLSGEQGTSKETVKNGILLIHRF